MPSWRYIYRATNDTVAGSAISLTQDDCELQACLAQCFGTLFYAIHSDFGVHKETDSNTIFISGVILHSETVLQTNSNSVVIGALERRARV